MINKISIIAMSSISALGSGEEEIWASYQKKTSFIDEKAFDKFPALLSGIAKNHWNSIEALRNTKNYKDLDASVLMAIYTARKAFELSSWKNEEFGINIGSSRGATSLFEKYYKEFIESNKGQVSCLKSIIKNSSKVIKGR